MSKLINYVGHSRVAGELKFRTAGDEKRIFQLEKLGDTDIRMVVLPEPMSKGQAAKWALTAEFFAKDTPEVFALFTANVQDENPFAKPAKKATAPKTVKAKNVKLVVGSATVSADDAPYTPKQAAKIRAEFMKKLKIAYEAN
jgi:hypothetical protein